MTFGQTPCWAQERLSYSSSLRDANGNCSEAAYTLVTRNRTPVVDPGETVEVEVFLSGYGFPDRNKLYVAWSSPYVIDGNNPGTITLCVRYETTSPEGDWRLETGKEAVRTYRLEEQASIAYVLTRGYFLKTTTKEDFADYGLEQVISEWTWDGEPPILLSMNTSKDAEPGDYEVQFVFTCSCGQNLAQDCKVVQFHVTSWWERYQKWVVGASAGIALLSLVVVASKSLCSVCMGRRLAAGRDETSRETPTSGPTCSVS